MNIKRRIKKALKTGGLKEIVRKLCFKLVYAFENRKTRRYVLTSKVQYGLNASEERKKKIIISLTSYKDRFDSICLCLKSLLLQEYKPDKIVVYFGSDVDQSDLTEEMLELCTYGIEYRFDVTQNLRSYKKFFYAMREFSEDIIITVDDDVLYPKYWLKRMMESYDKYPNAVSAWRLHLMKKNQDGRLLPYNYWIDQYRKIKEPSFCLFPTGVGGILYPPHSLHERVFDKETFMKYCFYADDIWLKCMSVLNNTKVVWVESKEVSFATTEKKQRGALSNMNVGESGNDKVLNELLPVLGLNVDDFFKE